MSGCGGEHQKSSISTDSGFRDTQVGNYLIFFRPVQDGIEVIRVLYGKRHITGRFF
jgi:plasmid stabilization system protein ParE